MPAPWGYVRYKLAQHWGVHPLVVDWTLENAPGEVEEVLAIWAAEAQAEQRGKGG
jgi:hypothetical protein